MYYKIYYIGYISLLNDVYVVNPKRSKSLSYNGISYTIKRYSDERYTLEDLICIQNQTSIPTNIVGINITILLLYI